MEKDIVLRKQTFKYTKYNTHQHSREEKRKRTKLQLPNPSEKVGLIVGRGGETVKSLQTKSGTRLQLIPQNLPEEDESKERAIRAG